MKIIITAILLGGIILAACNQTKKEKNSTSAGTQDHRGSKLTKASLYNEDSIKSYLTILNENEQEAGKKKFLEAIDLIKNKKQVGGSIIAFRQAAILYPSEKTYFELGSALLEDKKYAEALKALKISQLMGYSPLANVMYKLSALYSLMRNEKANDYGMYVNDSIALHYMEIALQMGYAKPSKFLEDKAFDSIRSYYNWEFKNTYNSAMSGNKDPEKLVWETYKSGFADLQLPLTINTVWIYQQKYENAIGYDYEKFVPEMRTGKFSREVDNEYFYAGKLREDSIYTALMYAGKNMWVTDGRGFSPVYYYLVTYSPSGKIIDKMHVGGQKTFTDNFRTLSLKDNLYFEVKDFKNIYEKDPGDNGYENNKVAKSDLISKANFRLNDKGKFEKVDIMQLAMR